MPDSSEDQQKKIIIDEGWKSQVQAEKEAALAEGRAAKLHPAKSPSDATVPLPPPDLTVLASNLYWQGMVMLGLLPTPGSDKPEVHLDHARHTIDTLEMLRQKTEGNRTPEETKEFDRILHELRLAYVEVGEGQKAE